MLDMDTQRRYPPRVLGVPCPHKRTGRHPHDMKPKHYAGSYQVDARNVKHAAAANPLTLCWRCHRTLDQHPPHHNGNPAYWTAGHTQHGSHTAQPWTAPLITRAQCDQAAHGDYLAPEASVCNYGAKDSTPVERIATTRHW